MSRLVLAITLMFTLLAGCAPAPVAPEPTPGLRKIRLPMGYIPSVQYANFYVAAEKGYFAAEGLEIEFDYSFETDGVKLVAANQLPFAVVSGEQVLLARAQNLPVVYVMAWFQHFPVAIMAKAETGLTSPADLRGKRVGVPVLGGANFIGLRAVLAQVGLTPEDVAIQAIGFNQVAALSAGQVDAVVVYANNEPIRLAAQGEKLTIFPVSDYARLAANGLMTNETILRTEPELVRGMVRALVRGIQDTLADPAAAYAIAKNYADLQDDALEQQVLTATLEMWQTQQIGRSDPQAWANMGQVLRDTGLLNVPLDVHTAYTNDFLP